MVLMEYADLRPWVQLMGGDPQFADLQPLESADGGAALRLAGHGKELTRPLRIVEHAPDILGPRFVDEVRTDVILRHAIPGPSKDEWDDTACQRLADLLCNEPFRLDPVPALSEGEDRIGWMTRNQLLRCPLPCDPALGRRLASDILIGQLANGSWGGLPETACAILNLLALGAAPGR